MFKIAKLISLTIAFCLAIYLSLKLATFVSEKFFFDKLIYQKNAEYGYVKESWRFYYNWTDKYILERIADLVELQRGGKENNSTSLPPRPLLLGKVLGVNTQKTYKVVVIGDSYVYGTGIKNEERFSIKLQQKLNQVRPARVYSLGYPGDDILQYITYYELAEKKIQPDLVIIAMVNNDFQIHVEDRDKSESEMLGILQSQCPGKILLYKWDDSYKKYLWADTMQKLFYPASKEEYANSCILSKAIGLMDKTKTIFFPIDTLPVSTDTLQNFNPNNINQEVDFESSQIMRKYGNIVASQNGYILHFEYSNIPINFLRVSQHEGHYSAYTNEKIAETLFHEIMNNPMRKFRP